MRPRRLFGILLIVATVSGAVVTLDARSKAFRSGDSTTESSVADKPQYLGASIPGLLAAFQLLASLMALVAWSPDDRTA